MLEAVKPARPIMYRKFILYDLGAVWDRMFGTYVNPESVKTDLAFGTGEKDPPWRAVLGI